MSFHILGIRHHGPGGARSVLATLEELNPDCILVEGPPDADSLLPLIEHAQMAPPVAILVYAQDDARKAVYYPFAEFSPEWQALKFGISRKIPTRFFDLPQSLRMGVTPETISDAGDDDDEKETTDDSPRGDPLKHLADAAGYSDSERWWEHFVEERKHHADVFAAILEAMTALREAIPEQTRQIDFIREAHMRQMMRAAEKKGFQKIAVICGAWHAPALTTLGPAKDDQAILKPLTKTKVTSTWVPWTYGRLTYGSGYGAGIQSPGWYHHLWSHPEHVTVGWMATVARVLRDSDLDASSAHVIESVRLADTLAAMRGRAVPGLVEMMEAAQSVLCHGSDGPLRVVRQKLLVSERMGVVPDESPTVPLQQDLARLQKKLRMPPEPTEKMLDLDQRKPTDLEKSQLLHRLNVLNIQWGEQREVTGKSGTFHEVWSLEWEPELAVRVIEASRYGNTIEDAANAFAMERAMNATELPALTELTKHALLADLSAAIPVVMGRLESLAAVTSDVAHLMEALPPMVNVLRYGNVRGTDSSMVKHVVNGLVARICVGLPVAVSSLDDDAADEMLNRVIKVHESLTILQEETHTNAWRKLLEQLSDQQGLHGFLAGRSTRLLLDAHVFSVDEAARRLGLALSRATEPAGAGNWLEGFLRNSGAILVHDDQLWTVIDRWVESRNPEEFAQLLPLLRRTFSTFEKPERRRLGERVKSTASAGGSVTTSAEGFDEARADQVIPVLRSILGLRGGAA